MSESCDSFDPSSGLLLVTGSNLRAEQGDRPIAYQLREQVLELSSPESREQRKHNIIVISDLWYLHCETLHRCPMISIGGPGVNAVSAHLLRVLPHSLLVDDQMVIQMDPDLNDQRVSIWGKDHQLTVDAVNLFIVRGYLDRFVQSVTAKI